MKEQAALAKMVTPSMKRNTWRNGILQIHITRACDKQCFGCTQGSNLGGKNVYLSTEEFEQAVISLKDYFGVVGIFGGNPAMHPKFEELCTVLRQHIPQEQCGLWCNKLFGKGKFARITFNPEVSNLNVHMDQDAYDEFYRDWPECRKQIKGHDKDSRHSPPFVAMMDVMPNEAERWELIANCDVNQNWSAMICTVPGKGLRGYFCEIAGAQAMLHADNPEWPDLGVPIEAGWWKQSIEAFAKQMKFHCHRCGVPLRRFGQLACDGAFEEFSATHADIYKPKDKNRRVELITLDSAPDTKTLKVVTNYIENSAIKNDLMSLRAGRWTQIGRVIRRALPWRNRNH